MEPQTLEWEICRRYHAAIRPLDRQKADQFYDKTLCQLIANRIRENIRYSPTISRPVSPTHLVTIATRQIQPVQTMVAALGIEHLLVLYTRTPDNFSEEARRIVAQCHKVGSLLSQPIPFEMPYDPESVAFPIDFATAMSQAIAEFVEGVEESQVVFDIDRGTTLHKYALLTNIIRPHNLIATLSHKMLPNSTIIDHGSERIFLFMKDEQWVRPTAEDFAIQFEKTM